MDLVPEADATNAWNFQILTEDLVNRAGRTRGTILHTSRTRDEHEVSGASLRPPPPRGRVPTPHARPLIVAADVPQRQ